MFLYIVETPTAEEVKNFHNNFPCGLMEARKLLLKERMKEAADDIINNDSYDDLKMLLHDIIYITQEYM